MILKDNHTATNAEYLQGITSNDPSVLKQIYSQSLPAVVKYVKNNSGTLEDAKDIFQEGILMIYRKVISKQLTLTTDFHLFLFMVCKRIWLKKLRRKDRKEVTIEELEEFSIEDNIEDRLLKSRKWKLFNKQFDLLGEECRKVLKMFFAGKSGKDIAEVMNYSVDYAKRKKYKCKLNLTNLIKKDPEYQHLTIL